MGTQRDYYLRLKISPKATTKEIKASFRRLARQHHPDLNPDNPEAAESFKAISEAYDTLSDPLKRRLYDRDRAANRSQRDYKLTRNNYSINYDAPELIQKAQNAQYFYRRGIAQAEAKQYQKAITEYSKAIALDPKFIDAYLKRSQMRYKLGDNQGVLDDCYWVIKIKPSFAKAYYYQGRARYSLGYVQASVDSYSEAIRQDKDYARAYYYRGIAYRALKEKSLAVKDLQIAAELFLFQGNEKAYRLSQSKINNLNRVNLNILRNLESLLGKNPILKIILFSLIFFLLILLFS